MSACVRVAVGRCLPTTPCKWEGSIITDIRLVIREENHDWSGTIAEDMADRAIAALSVDPVTLSELDAAVERFANRSRPGSFFAGLSAGLCAEPYDSGLVVIDLAARLVVVDSRNLAAERSGYVFYHDGERCTDKELRCHVGDDWHLTDTRDGWQTLAASRRRERAGQGVIDARQVLYGRPMLEYLARETWMAFARAKRSQLASVTSGGRGCERV